MFYTPIAARIIGYDLPVSAATRAYCEMLLADPVVLRWQQQARAVSYATEPYQLDLPRAPWPIG